MPKCPLCGKEVSSDELILQFFDDEGSEHYVCENCDAALNCIAENNDGADEALEKIKQNLCRCKNEKLKQYLSDIVDSYTENIKTESENQKSNSSNTTFWISSLKGVYKFVFFVIIIVGIVLCAMFCSNEMVGVGFIALAIAVIVAVLVVGFAMVFLDLARDIHQIRNILEEQRNDEE